MLTHLYIKNFTLIDELDMDFHTGFSVITGETGAGKSIILGALGLLTGQRADVKSIKQGADKCTVEAHFNIAQYGLAEFFERNDIEYDDTDCIIRREISASGKSRAFVNDVPVPLATMKEIGERLIDIHSQHQNLLLNKEDFQLNVVDLIAADAEQLATYSATFAEYRKAVQRLKELEENIAANREREDFMRFQYNELNEAKLKDGEQEELEQESETMTHAEDIKAALYQATEGIDGDNGGMLSALHNIVGRLNGISNIFPAVAELAERLESCRIEMKDIANDLSARTEDIDFDPSRLEQVADRLNLIYSLEKKYRTESIAALIEMRNELQTQLTQIDNSDEEINACRQQAQQLMQRCTQLAETLTNVRRKAAESIESSLQQMLADLGIPKVRFGVSLEEKELSPTGADRVSFLFSANSSTPLQPVSQVASGGEIARVMLSLKAMISTAVKLPTIIFDEIDTGVSGSVAEKMAQMMAQMGAGGRQVIAITHLPQIAALGTTHYQVAKDETEQGTVSRMTRLDDEGRIAEIAKMLSGSDVSAAAISNAKTLLKKA